MLKLASIVIILCLFAIPAAMALRHLSLQATAKKTAVISKTTAPAPHKTTTVQPSTPTKTAPAASAPTPPQPTVAAAPAPAPKPAPTPAPQPVATTQPVPGSGVQQLQPTASQPTSQTSTPSTQSTASSTSAPAAATGGYQSTNWSGYTAQQGVFTGISGSWTVPTVTGQSGTSSGDAAWIGIGGISSSDLIQVGTDDTVAADGTVSHYAFYELLPDAALDITALPVNTGDVMTASLTETASGVWTISITDTTTGQTYTTSVHYTSSHSSADWIEEDPSYTNGSLVPFDSFDHVSFTQGNATVNGALTTIAASNASPITLVNSSHQPLATPSVLLNGGTGFWVSHN